MSDWLSLNEDYFFAVTKKQSVTHFAIIVILKYLTTFPLVKNSHQNLFNFCLQNLIKHTSALSLIYNYLISENISSLTLLNGPEIIQHEMDYLLPLKFHAQFY